MSQKGTAAPIRRLLGVAMAMAVVVAACGGSEATQAPTAAPPTATAAPGEPTPDPAAELAALKSRVEGKTLRVGSSASPNASVIGFFKTLEFLEQDFGVTVEKQLLDSDPLVAGMISGQIDVGQLSLSGTANANSAGATFTAFGVNDQKNLFVVAAKAPTSTLEELRGQTFGATQNLRQITGQTATKCLASVGIDIEKDVQLIRFNNTGEVTSAIRAGQVVAGISATFRLTRIILEEGNIINVLCYGRDENPSISSVWMADRAWVDQNQDLALALIISELRAARWAKENKQGWIDLAKEVIEGYTDEAGSIDYDEIVIKLDNWPVNGGLEQEICQQTLDTSFQFGAITEEMKCEDIADFSFQERALELIGRQ
jgi:ABC-type nitrate/sulfonate/bicarbonate transport system substrate-binding protein